MEHLHHFHLSQDPFQNEPDLRFYFDSALHRDVQRRMERGLRQHKGLSVLTGEGGTGKTLLARRILDALEEEIFDANLMVILAGAADAVSVLSRFARQVGVEAPSDDRSAMLAQLYEQLAIVREDGRHCVLILDDAQTLSRESMSEVGGLLNLEYEDRRLLSLLLVGLPELDVMISHDASLAARVDVRVMLQPLDLQNATAYVAHRLAVAGGSAEVFSQESIGTLFKFSRGRPRLLNTLADNSLFEAYLGGRQQANANDVERAAADLGIGADPGSTYQSVPVSAAGGPPAFEAPDGAATIVADFGDPDDNALELSVVAPSAPGDDGDELDLSALLEDDGVPEAELTTVLTGPAPGATRDLDGGVRAEELPVFAASNRSGGDAGATRLALIDDAPAAQPAAQDSDSEIDDLFVELIEE